MTPHMEEAAKRMADATVQMAFAEQARRLSETRTGVAATTLLITALDATMLAQQDIGDALALVEELK